MWTVREEISDGPERGAGEQQERRDLQRRKASLEERLVSRMAEHHARGDGKGDEAETTEEDDVQPGDALTGPEEREDQPGGQREQRQLCGERRPAFVSDCLETLEEIAIRGRELFTEAGGEEFALIPCLNEHPRWLDALEKMVRGGIEAFDQS